VLGMIAALMLFILARVDHENVNRIAPSDPVYCVSGVVKMPWTAPVAKFQHKVTNAAHHRPNFHGQAYNK
jgi:hypothetical protein